MGSNFWIKKGNPNFRLNSTVSFDISSFSHLDIVQASVGLIMASLHEVLTTAGVQDTFVDKLIEDGWSTELFAMAAPNLEKLDDEIRSMLGDLYDITTAVQRSALRLAWTRCQAMQVPAVPAPGPSASTQSEVSASQSTWSETYPPKLTSEVVSALKQKFKRNYPAEILLPETTPSLRLLSLIHHQKLKGEYKWVPWKYRLSQAKADEITAVKPNRIAKSEGLQLHALLVDSPPELHIDNGALGMHALRQTFETFSYAMAMCEIVHLATMKNYYLKFINLMTTRLEAETGLRNPTILEAQSADKTLMTIACELVMEKQWSFDDAIHEVTCIRAEINTLLQARPRLPRQTYQRLESGSSKGGGKNNRSTPYGKGKTGKSSGKSSGKTGGKVTWITETSVGGSKKQLCMRFQSGKCDMGASCRFHHGCAFPLPSGEACNKNHGALMHYKTPH